MRMVYSESFDHAPGPSYIVESSIQQQRGLFRGQHQFGYLLVFQFKNVAWPMGFGDDHCKPGRVRKDGKEGQVIVVLPYLVTGELFTCDLAENAVSHFVGYLLRSTVTTLGLWAEMIGVMRIDANTCSTSLHIVVDNFGEVLGRDLDTRYSRWHPCTFLPTSTNPVQKCFTS